jgi:hypothetical protein
LTHKETLALAGEVYRALADTREDDPGSPEQWLQAEAGNLRDEAGQFGRAALMILSDEERRAKSIEERVGGFSNGMLARRGFIIDQESRRR